MHIKQLGPLTQKKKKSAEAFGGKQEDRAAVITQKGQKVPENYAF